MPGGQESCLTHAFCLSCGRQACLLVLYQFLISLLLSYLLILDVCSLPFPHFDVVTVTLMATSRADTL